MYVLFMDMELQASGSHRPRTLGFVRMRETGFHLVEVPALPSLCKSVDNTNIYIYIYIFFYICIYIYLDVYG